MFRRSRPLLPILLTLAVSACIGGGPPAAPQGTAAVATPAATASEPSSSSASPSSVATASAEPTATIEPVETPPSEPSGSPASGGTVADCTGTDDNRTFFSNAAAAFDWPVYCAALPARWFVGTGSFSGARGGKLVIDYKGPGGARLELQEGAFCTDGTGCVPEGSDAGSVAFGDQSATLVHFEDGRVAAVVARGQALSWLAVGTELTDDAFESILAALIRLD